VAVAVAVDPSRRPVDRRRWLPLPLLRAAPSGLPVRLVSAPGVVGEAAAGGANRTEGVDEGPKAQC